ncbi:MAG: ATPase [Ignavibacteriae bacterium HGW-Ignavibacteriae-3]|nr:MAG: ATPase [Ignavibacteriae bacterium HGW-Ignavibacteriae-3]
MGQKLTATTLIDISASAAEVWKALTTPELIKKYFFGTEAISDWKVGSSLHFKGKWEENEYLDKGTILEMIPEKLFRYSYLSSMSGLEDKIENYSNICYSLTEDSAGIRLIVTQDNIETREKVEHSTKVWEFVLNELKKLLESTN